MFTKVPTKVNLRSYSVVCKKHSDQMSHRAFVELAFCLPFTTYSLLLAVTDISPSITLLGKLHPSLWPPWPDDYDDKLILNSQVCGQCICGMEGDLQSIRH